MNGDCQTRLRDCVGALIVLCQSMSQQMSVILTNFQRWRHKNHRLMYEILNLLDLLSANSSFIDLFATGFKNRKIWSVHLDQIASIAGN
jgi:hypothetical protein